MRHRTLPRPLLFGLLVLLAAAGLAGCALQEAGPSEAQPAQLKQIYAGYPELRPKSYEIVKVTRVVDGDTFVIEGDLRVRLIGVDTPETVKPGSPVEYYGKEASAFTKDRLEGRTVYLFRDVSDTDRYGRLLRYTFVEGDKEMFNETLVREGYANIMTYPPDVMYAERFLALERQAREQGTGLWGRADAPAPPGSGCPDPRIQGNPNSRIYHVPGGQHYDQLKTPVLFCTEEEAEEAGYRKSQR